jgi:putative addiction module component (TIGR02574 family)
MGNSAKSIIDQALDLSPIERLQVAEQLLCSLDQPDPSIDQFWAEECESRRDAYNRGELTASDAMDVIRRYKKT